MSGPDARRTVRVRPDVVGIERQFDYLVPAGMEAGVGDVVRIDLHGRRVGGWVTEVDPAPEPGRELRPLAKVSGRGPGADIIELAGWAAWRWAGRPVHLLRTASAPSVVHTLRTGSTAPDEPLGPSDPPPSDPAAGMGAQAALVAEALGGDRAVLRWPPALDRYGLVRAAAVGSGRGQVLVLCPCT